MTGVQTCALPICADKSELLLLWAGRAVTHGRPDLAQGMLDAIVVPPPDQGWRVEATKALIAIADGRDEEGIAAFQALADAGAPGDGLQDALATAAGLTKNTETAGKLAGQLKSVAAARGLLEAGSSDGAREAVPPGDFAKYLENQ